MATTITSAGVTFSDSSTLTTKAASSTYRGDAYGLRYTFDSTVRTGTGASDGPAKGNFSLNSSTLANVTRLYLNIFNANGTDVSNFIADWGSTAAAHDAGGQEDGGKPKAAHDGVGTLTGKNNKAGNVKGGNAFSH